MALARWWGYQLRRSAPFIIIILVLIFFVSPWGGYQLRRWGYELRGLAPFIIIILVSIFFILYHYKRRKSKESS